MEPTLNIMLHSTVLRSTSYRSSMDTPQSRQRLQRQALRHLHPRSSHSTQITQRTRDAPYLCLIQKLFVMLQKTRSCQDLALVTLQRT